MFGVAGPYATNPLRPRHSFACSYLRCTRRVSSGPKDTRLHGINYLGGCTQRRGRLIPSFLGSQLNQSLAIIPLPENLVQPVKCGDFCGDSLSILHPAYEAVGHLGASGDQEDKGRGQDPCPTPQAESLLQACCTQTASRALVAARLLHPGAFSPVTCESQATARKRSLGRSRP